MAQEVIDTVNDTAIAFDHSRNVTKSDSSAALWPEKRFLRCKTAGTLVFVDPDLEVCDYGTVEAGDLCVGLARQVRTTSTGEFTSHW